MSESPHTVEMLCLDDYSKAVILLDGRLVAAWHGDDDHSMAQKRVPSESALQQIGGALASTLGVRLEEAVLLRPQVKWKWSDFMTPGGCVLPRIPRNSRYAGRVIDGRPERFDAVEIQPVKVTSIRFENGRQQQDVEVVGSAADADFFSTYLHYRPESGEEGVVCIGDHKQYEDAAAYAWQVAQRHGYEINDFAYGSEVIDDVDWHQDMGM